MAHKVQPPRRKKQPPLERHLQEWRLRTTLPPMDQRIDRSFETMKVFCTLFFVMLLTGCADQESNRPTVYRGRQYYGDTIHSDDPVQR
jgi:hypothetical protein